MNRIILAFLLLTNVMLADAQRMMDIMRNMYEKPERVCQLLLKGEGDSIIALGNSSFAAAANPDMFKDIVPTLEKQFGRFHDMEGWTAISGYDNMKVYSRKLVFERYTIPLVVSFDNEGKLAGLVFQAPQAVSSPKAVNERDIEIETDGLKMPGRVTLPMDGKEKHPCVILVHGSGPSDMNESVGGHKPFLDIAEGLSKLGMVVIRYDKRTFTHKENSVPTGKKADYDTETVDDALSAVALARDMKEVYADSIYIIGHSLGAMLAPRIAEKANGNVAGIIAMAAPARKMRELLVEQLTYITKSSADSVSSQVNAIMGTLPESYLAMDKEYSPVTTAKTLEIPMFFMQGERDYQVTRKDFGIWKTNVGERDNVSMKLYPKLNHLFTEDEGMSVPDEYLEVKHIPMYVMEDIINFIRKGKVD